MRSREGSIKIKRAEHKEDHVHGKAWEGGKQVERENGKERLVKKRAENSQD